MRRQKYYFDLKFEISAKLRFEWCITLYDSFWIYWNFPNSLYLHAYAKKNSRENIGKFKMNHIKLYIIRSTILRWFRIWGQKNIFAYAFKRKTRFKNFAWADPKNFAWFESGVKFWFEIYPYFTKLKIISSRIAHGQKI